jgi:hypothetical protein
MAQSSIKVGGTNIRVDIQVEGLERADRAFKEIRREAGMKTRQAVRTAAEEEVLPEARRAAGNLKVDKQSVGQSLVIRKGLSNTVYLTSSMRGKKGRAIGLLEYGGTVRARIHPKRKTRRGHPAALQVGPGIFRAAVNKPRHYKPRNRITNAVTRSHPNFVGKLEDAILRQFQGHGFEVGR